MFCENSCYECEKEYFSGKKETFYVSAHTFEKAKEKAIRENPTCYVKVVKEIKMS